MTEAKKITGLFHTYTEFYVGFNHWEMAQGLQDICPALSRALFWASSHQEVNKPTNTSDLITANGLIPDGHTHNTRT